MIRFGILLAIISANRNSETPFIYSVKCGIFVSWKLQATKKCRDFVNVKLDYISYSDVMYTCDTYTKGAVTSLTSLS